MALGRRLSSFQLASRLLASRGQSWPLGFAPAYTCEVNPELPGTGQWGCSHHGFGRDGEAAEPFRSRWGTPLIVRVAVTGTRQWVGWFEAGGMGTLTGVFACPRPTDALVVCDGQAYLVDVTAPTRTTVLDLEPVTRVCRVRDLDPLLVVGFVFLAALGPAGLAWHSERLCLDDLRVLDATADGIHCRGDLVGSVAEFTVDPHSGRLRAGSRFLDGWPGR